MDSCSVWKNCYICAFTAFSDKDCFTVRGGGDEDWGVVCGIADGLAHGGDIVNGCCDHGLNGAVSLSINCFC